MSGVFVATTCMVYQHIQEVTVGKDLECHYEPNNHIDCYAVAVVQSDTVVGHL